MTNSFSCPSCGGTLQIPGTARTVKCQYCGTVAQVPDELWQPMVQTQALRQWKTWIIVFLVLTVGLPTCLGLLGTLLGIGGGLLGIIAPFVAGLLGR